MSQCDTDVYDRARRLANLAIWTVHLQFRRIHSDEPEDNEFVFRRFADFAFFIVALVRLRRAAVLASCVVKISETVKAALEDFDKAIPNLQTIRNVAEHIDGYALEKGRDKNIRILMLEVGSKFGTKWTVFDQEIDIEVGLNAADTLFERLRALGSALEDS